jgi:hypothetical protein
MPWPRGRSRKAFCCPYRSQTVHVKRETLSPEESADETEVEHQKQPAKLDQSEKKARRGRPPGKKNKVVENQNGMINGNLAVAAKISMPAANKSVRSVQNSRKKVTEDIHDADTEQEDASDDRKVDLTKKQNPMKAINQLTSILGSESTFGDALNTDLSVMFNPNIFEEGTFF